MDYMITGAASGIGLATATLLASRFAGESRLLLVDRNGSALDEAAHSLTGRGAHIITSVADLSDATSADRVAVIAQDEFGKLDGVVSNAGVVHAYTLAALEIDEYERVFNINTRAGWLLAKATYGLLKKCRGSLVAVASITSLHPLAGGGIYAASKAALVMLVKQLALEWAEDGIRCNCVSPGTTLTAMTQAALADPAVRANRAQRVPSGRVGECDDAAQAIAFLLSAEASFINGANLTVDGGLDVALFYRAGAPAIR